MKIRLKLYAFLSDYLPSGADNQVAEIEAGENSTPQQIIHRFNIPVEKVHLVLLNGVYIQPSDRDLPKLKDGDSLAIWPKVG